MLVYKFLLYHLFTEEDLINSFKEELNITYEKLSENVGPGVARQYILDKTTSPYICFLDADDLLYYPETLEEQYKALEDGHELAVSYVLNERDNTKVFNGNDLHAKMFTRDFINKYNIKFPPTRVHEDNVFMSLTIIYCPYTCFIEEIGYLYCNNNESITSVPDDIEFERLKILIDNTDIVIRQTIKDSCDEFSIKQFIFEKTKYLSKIYNSSNEDRKITLKKWVSSSLLDENHLDNTDTKKLKEIIIEVK